MTGLVSFLLGLTALGMAAAHDWGMGACPRVDPVPSLAVEKFLGLWYVIQQTDTDSHCLKLNYTRVSETQLRVTKLRQFGLLDQVGVEHTNSYSGTLDLPHENDLGRMRVKWPLNMAGKGDYIVFDTDYTNYAGIYECQTMTTLMHRKSAAILSREPVLAQEYIDRVRRRLTSFGVGTEDMDTISHLGCRTRAEADVNIHVDSDTFSSVMSGARTGIEEAASTVGQGFKDLASTFSWISGDAVNNVRTTFGLPSPTSPTGPDTTKETVDKTTHTVTEAVEKSFDVSTPAPTTEVPASVAVTKAVETTKEVAESVTPGPSTTGGSNDIANEIAGGEQPAGTQGGDNKENLDRNLYNIDNADVEPVDDVIRTVVSIDKKKKK